METPRLQEAIVALKKGKRQDARKLLLAIIKDNPKNITAWLWAVEVAASDKEKKYILRKILSLDPDHAQARQYLVRLESPAAQTPVTGKTTNQKDPTNITNGRAAQKPSRLASLIMLILEGFSTLPLTCGFLLIFGITIIGGFLYFQANTNFFGLVGTDFDQLQISNSYQDLSLDDDYWKVTYEGGGRATFSGTVRHISPIRVNEFGILTHDVLVTSADFADPELVDTSVINHKFTWYARGPAHPEGTINLLHTVPSNASVYQNLLDIKKWDEVQISGYEIFTITGYTSDGTEVGVWKDAGCNTLLVESISITK